MALNLPPHSGEVISGVEGVGAVEALGLDETLFARQGRWCTRRWCTSIVDVCGGQLLDIVAGRDAERPIRWLMNQPQAWRDNITWGTLDLSGAYRRTFDVALPNAPRSLIRSM